MIEPHTWTDEELISLMMKEARAYVNDQKSKNEPWSYHDMMECVLLILKDKNLIQETP